MGTSNLDDWILGPLRKTDASVVASSMTKPRCGSSQDERPKTDTLIVLPLCRIETNDISALKIPIFYKK